VFDSLVFSNVQADARKKSSIESNIFFTTIVHRINPLNWSCGPKYFELLQFILRGRPQYVGLLRLMRIIDAAYCDGKE
jgi:hypothetical protein